MLVSIALGGIVAEATTDRRVSGFYRSDFTKGIAYEGPMHLSTKGFLHYIYEDASVQTFRTALYSNEVIFIHTHGSAGYFFLTPTVHVSKAVLDESNTPINSKLVYISACNAGLTSSTSGNVCLALCNKGAETVVGFEDTVAATTGTDGIHRFNSLVVYKLVNGYTISSAMSSALEQFMKEVYEETGEYDTYGADSYVIYGNGYLTITN